MPTDSLLMMPSSTHARSYQAAVDEGYRPDPAAPALNGSAASLEAHIAWLNEQGGQIRLPDGTMTERAPHVQLWLTHAYTFIGRVNIRFRLTPDLQVWGGHIGYEIRPSFRRRGFGTHLLGLAIPTARAAGLGGLLLTCLDSNIGSIKIIEANGGKRIGAGPHRWQPELTALRFWIEEP